MSPHVTGLGAGKREEDEVFFFSFIYLTMVDYALLDIIGGTHICGRGGINVPRLETYCIALAHGVRANPFGTYKFYRFSQETV